MGKVITIANRKGGVAKTTTAINVGAILQEKGYKVLFIDLDKQADTSKTLKASLNVKGSYDILANQEEAIDIIQVIDNKYNVISASKELSRIDNILNDASNSLGREQRLKNSLKSINNYFDFIVIDTPPDINNITINALTCTDYLVITSMASVYSVDGATALYNNIENIKKYSNPNLQIGGILLTCFNSKTILANDIKEALEDMASKYGNKVYKTKIRRCTALEEAQALNQPITDYDIKHNSNGYKDYLSLVNEILEDIG